MKVFTDTSALIALIDKDDIFHIEALDIFKKVAKNKYKSVTSNYIIIETIVILKNRLGLEAVRLLNDEILPAINILWIDKKIHSLAVNSLIHSNSRKISLVDFTSFELMRISNTGFAFTFDKHFSDMGFQVLK